MDQNKLEDRKVVDLPIEDILPNRFQPRIKFDDSAIFELSESIKAHGVFQPIIVRPIGDKYEIIAGERRYKASVLAGKQTIPAIIMDLNDNDTVEIALIENVQRANLTPIEEAISYKKILDMGYLNQELLAQKLGKNQSTIANKLRLLNLDEEVQEALLENKISERHARSLLKLKNYEDQKKLLSKIVSERLTVRKTDEEIDRMLNNDQNFKEENNSSIIEPVTLSETPINPFVIPSNNNVSFGDINNEIINPISFDNQVNNSTVISSENIIPTEIPKMETNIDINTIEQNAYDFNTAKPVAPMDQFLQVNSTVNTNDNSTPVLEEEPISSGKFFNFSSEINNTPVTNVDYNESKNYNFDNLYGNTTENINLINDNSMQNQVNNPIISNDFNTTQDINDNEIGILDEQSPSNSSFNPFSFNNPVEISATEEKNLNIVPEEVPLPTTFGFDNTNISSNIEEDILSVPNPHFENLSYQELPSTPIIGTEKNILEAVNIIRKASEEIKKLGFDIDIDEIDLESIYQLIIKIEK